MPVSWYKTAVFLTVQVINYKKQTTFLTLLWFFFLCFFFFRIHFQNSGQTLALIPRRRKHISSVIVSSSFLLIRQLFFCCLFSTITSRTEMDTLGAVCGHDIESNQKTYRSHYLNCERELRGEFRKWMKEVVLAGK